MPCPYYTKIGKYESCSKTLSKANNICKSNNKYKFCSLYLPKTICIECIEPAMFKDYSETSNNNALELGLILTIVFWIVLGLLSIGVYLYFTIHRFIS